MPDVPILSVTKGLLESPRSSRMDRIDVVVAEHVGRPLRFVHAAGPAKAMEIARGVLTWMFFAGAPDDATLCARALAGDGLCVTESADIAGAELCSALKNAYATGLGLWDGLVGKDAHNARAACFTQAIDEMRRIVLAGGGRAETVHGSAGVGDLHVTAAAGRNRAFGERVGRGQPAKRVAAEMLAAGELTEGYAAIAAAWRFARERGVKDLPLLESVNAVVWEGRGRGVDARRVQAERCSRLKYAGPRGYRPPAGRARVVRRALAAPSPRALSAWHASGSLHGPTWPPCAGQPTDHVPSSACRRMARSRTSGPRQVGGECGSADSRSVGSIVPNGKRIIGERPARWTGVPSGSA